MVQTMTRKNETPPIDATELADWLAPRPGENYEQWSKRFDKAEREIARRSAKPTLVRSKARPRATQPRRRAA
jgi:hypothetical protein